MTFLRTHPPFAPAGRRPRAVSSLFAALLCSATTLTGSTGASAARSATSQPSSSAPLVHLPADQASHPTSHNEWWYVVGHLRSGSRTFGYEVTTFRLSHVQVPGMNGTVSLYRTDIAITDEARKRFLQRVTYYFPQSVSVSQTTLDVHVGTVTLRGDSLTHMTLRASIPKSSIKLQLASQRSPMYVGGRGYMQMANGFTYYYSLTDLATSGTLVVAGKRYAVIGISWLDHQWGNWTWSTVKGWTWMALQLNNGVQMSVFDFRSTASRVRAASVLLANGQLRTIGGITISSVGSWRSPHTGGVYPSGWIVRIPALGAIFHVTPTVLDQEVTSPGLLRASYWEGSGHIQGTYQGRPISGLSYTELTGYAGTAPSR